MKEGIPKRVLDAIQRGDTKALHKMAAAGGKASGEKRASKAAFDLLRRQEMTEDAEEAERAHNMDSNGDVQPPEEVIFNNDDDWPRR